MTPAIDRLQHPFSKRCTTQKSHVDKRFLAIIPLKKDGCRPFTLDRNIRQDHSLRNVYSTFMFMPPSTITGRTDVARIRRLPLSWIGNPKESLSSVSTSMGFIFLSIED